MVSLWFSRLVHGIQRLLEDAQAPEYGTVQQWKALWRPERKKVIPMNLKSYRTAVSRQRRTA